MNLIDIGVNFHSSQLRGLGAELLARATDAGVTHVLAKAALRTSKPLFLHCRDAFDDFHAMLREAAGAGAHGVVHCFTDGAAQAEAYLALGFDIGITGWVTDAARGAALRDALRVVPLDRLHLETDAPYLRPKNAGKTRPYNEPALLPFVAPEVARLKNVDTATLAAHATANGLRLFKLPP